MYNIHSHYETIFHALTNIVTHRRVLYLYPYGSTQPENIESISDNIEKHGAPIIKDGPLLICYDQEPLLGGYNYPFFDAVSTRQGPKILVTTEKDSDPLDHIKEKYDLKSVYYFHHAFAAHDWFRGYRYDTRLIAPKDRTLKKKFVTFNRLTSNHRVYRSLLISELYKRNILEHGYVSYSDVCPDNRKTYMNNLSDAHDTGLISKDTFWEAVDNLKQIPMPLRIDFADEHHIPNHSFQLSAVEQTQESFCYLVTETCYWERKHHLTEKIFKPIVSRMPFVLVGPAHNLKYLREYGFKTFDKWIDESYDDIQDPILRMEAIGNTMSKICNLSHEALEDLLIEMSPVLEHNYNLFYSNKFLDHCWEELMTNLKSAINEF
jgi:hypothetical protein